MLIINNQLLIINNQYYISIILGFMFYNSGFNACKSSSLMQLMLGDTRTHKVTYLISTIKLLQQSSWNLSFLTEL